jgi:hypothetical protein
MTFDFSKRGAVRITAEKFVSDLLLSSGVKGNSSTPATSGLYTIDEDSPRLSKLESEDFHSKVAKLLYLSRRTRPDIQFAVGFLTTRVLCPTEEDDKKLYRVLKYINGSKELGIVLEASRVVEVISYIDASYAIHRDGKSHTGSMISLGKGPIVSKSAKQSIVTKSSHESELVGASDAVSPVIGMRDFLIHQGYEVGPATVFQDNMSTIASHEKGRASGDRSKHINVRYFFIKDRIKSGEVKIVYKPTAEMIADILTKPLQGDLFRKLRDELLNWSDSAGKADRGVLRDQVFKK